MSEFSSESSEMSPVSEAAILIRRVAEPRPVGDKVKAAIRRAAQALGFSFSRAKDIWYEDARRIDASEMDALREQAGIYEAVAAKLRHQDEDFHRTQADAYEHYARILRGVAGPGINGGD
jgi:hypothetical protein